jgi:hypothetical protein
LTIEAIKKSLACLAGSGCFINQILFCSISRTATLGFWNGYYTFYIPFDILFMFLSIGMINAIQLRPLVKSPTKWVRQCILVYFLAAIAGIVIGLGGHLLYFKNLQGIARDLATWLSIGIPAALVVAYSFKYILTNQIIIPEDYESDFIPGQKVPVSRVA